MKEIIRLGHWTEEKLSDLIYDASSILDPGRRTDFLSGHFLNTAYKDATLIGDIHIPEEFVIDLEGVDCFTFIEYVEAMRRSRSFTEFKDKLQMVRYRHGVIEYKSRNHFFTDWKAFNSEFIVDVTKYLGAPRTKDVSKGLNEKHDGTFFLPGISCRMREVTYIQSTYINDDVLENLRTGDYGGIYSKEDGLDVSHVGIIIKTGGKVYLRHASSRKNVRKVVDEVLSDYLKAKAGLIVFRPRD